MTKREKTKKGSSQVRPVCYGIITADQLKCFGREFTLNKNCIVLAKYKDAIELREKER